MNSFIYDETLPVGRIALEFIGARLALTHFCKYKNATQIIIQKKRIHQLREILLLVREKDEVRNDLTSKRWLNKIKLELIELDAMLEKSDEIVSCSLVSN